MQDHYTTPSVFVEKQCLNCGKSIKVYACKARRGNGKYCSRPCKNAYKNRPDQIAARFWPRVKKGKPDECWLWTGFIHKGYGVTSRGKGSPVGAHRVAYELTHGPIPSNVQVCHSCDTPLCCNPSHLWLGTTQQNTADCVQKGRTAKGDKSPMRLYPERYKFGDRHWTRRYPEKLNRGINSPSAKLTEEQVKAIRAERLNDKVSYPKLARKYGMHTSTVFSIVAGQTWKHLL